MSEEVHSELSGCWWWRNLFEGLHYDACCVVVIYLNHHYWTHNSASACIVCITEHRNTSGSFLTVNFLRYPNCPLGMNERTDDCSQLSPFYSAHVDRCICYPADLLKSLFISSVSLEISLWFMIAAFLFFFLFFFFQCYVCFEKCWARSWKMAHGKVVPVCSFSDKWNMLTNTACRLRGHLRIMFVRANSEFQIPDCYFVLINVRDFAEIIISSHHHQQPSTCWGWGKTRYLYPGAIGDGAQHFARRHVSVEVEAGLQPDHSLLNSAHQSWQPPKESVFNQN